MEFHSPSLQKITFPLYTLLDIRKLPLAKSVRRLAREAQAGGIPSADINATGRLKQICQLFHCDRFNVKKSNRTEGVAQ